MNKEHYDIVKQGADVIAEWRRENPGERPSLACADLRGARLYGASLRRASLCGADLRGADLGGADLRGADLRRARLYGASLRRADLCGADLWGADGIWCCGPGGSRGDMLYVVKHATCLMVKAGCFWGTMAEFETAVEQAHGDNVHGRYYRAMIVAAKAWAGQCKPTAAASSRGPSRRGVS